MKQRTIRRTVSFGSIWFVFVSVAMFTLIDYSTEAGASAIAPEHWPKDSELPRSENERTLLLFAHPECPCTKATLSELARVLADVGGAVSTLIVFYESNGEAWADASLRRVAEAIPNARSIRDIEALEARRFGVQTSGQILLYDSEGALSFAGGITPGRGHEGSNTGRSALTRCLREGAATAFAPPVFGCVIVDADGMDDSQ